MHQAQGCWTLGLENRRGLRSGRKAILAHFRRFSTQSNKPIIRNLVPFVGVVVGWSKKNQPQLADRG